MVVLSGRSAQRERPAQSIPAHAPPVATAPSSPVDTLARRLCLELQALTGNANSSVLLDVVARRLRVGLRELEPALALGAEAGWIERRSDSVALRDEGRQATLVDWPPREPLRAQNRYR